MKVLMLRVFVILCAGLSVVTWASELSKEERDRMFAEGHRAAKARCNVVAGDLRDQWPYYGDFRVYKIGFSTGGPVNNYYCSISANHVTSQRKMRVVRVEIDQRHDSDRFVYRIGPDNGIFPDCYKETLLQCAEDR